MLLMMMVFCGRSGLRRLSLMIGVGPVASARGIRDIALQHTRLPRPLVLSVCHTATYTQPADDTWVVHVGR